MKLGPLRIDANGLKTIVALIVSLCVLDIIHTYLGGVGEGLQLSWTYLFVGVPEFWITYLVVLPLAIALAGRYRLDLHQWRTVLPHVVGGFVFAYVHMLLVAGAPFISLRPELPFASRLFRIMRMNFASDFLAYWAIVGATYIARHYSELHRRQVSEARLETSLAQAQLEALQAQLRPHFFFNTLQAISVLALKGDKNGVVETLGHLGNLVRVTCDSKRPQKVTLASELEFLEEYLAIQQLSLGDRFHVERHIDADTLRALVPSMLLQPVIENAIVHGVACRQGSGTIALAATRVNGTLELRVADSGPGFGRMQHRDGIGLANTRGRLQRTYGSEFRLELGDDTITGGGCVSISIPYEPSDATVPSYEEQAVS
jgi:sensor histidine kinase YesM